MDTISSFFQSPGIFTVFSKMSIGRSKSHFNFKVLNPHIRNTFKCLFAMLVLLSTHTSEMLLITVNWSSKMQKLTKNKEVKKPLRGLLRLLKGFLFFPYTKKLQILWFLAFTCFSAFYGFLPCRQALSTVTAPYCQLANLCSILFHFYYVDSKLHAPTYKTSM